MQDSHIHWIDYIIVIFSVLLAIGVGMYFARRQKSTDNYFAGGRNIPAWAIGMSIFATLISSVTFLAYPGAAYASNWILLVQGLMVPIVLVAMIGVIVPLYRKVIKLSTYEYFERRFGYFARLYGSIAFILGHFSKMGTVFYLVSLAMASFMGIDIYIIIAVLGIAIILLTLLGGMEAVIWMDVIQGFMLIAGGLICAGMLLFMPEGGPSNVINTALDMGKISFGPYDWDLTKLTFIVMVLNGIFYAIQKYGTDQTIVQRYLAAKDDKAAKKAAYIGVFMSVPIWTLFMFIGTGLYIFYQSQGAPPLPEGIKADAVFPHFIATQTPVGITGIIIAALAAGAISSLDSDMNCLAAIGVQDFYVRFKPQSTDKQRLRLGRFLVLLSGVAAVGVAMLYAYWQGEGVLGIVFSLYAIFSAGIVGLFLLGLLSRRANKQGLYVGIAAAVLFTAYAMLTSSKFDFGDGLGKRLILDMGSLNFTHHKYMLGVYSHLVLFGVGYIASFFFKTPLADKELTIHGYLEKKKK
ncbi:sodium transporter [Bacteroides sp. 214]|uniref:sodium:solute symporter n=1 Tax=Bacteroides sp. 214 TaxID=2302935 RepID=UPI0013D69C54|nr:sodium:solute symporter [Bacteroides sp. 214]NDW12415.1 sodium transporter [Bacteroides sp. 214]